MTDHKNWISEYLKALGNVIEHFPIEDLSNFITMVEDVRENEKTLFICGNGGSWATAAHMVCDLGKNTRMQGTKRMRVIGLGDNIPSLTAYANDEGFDRVFSEPLISSGFQPPACAFIVIDTNKINNVVMICDFFDCTFFILLIFCSCLL